MALVGVDWLRDRLGDSDVAIVDCRWSLLEPGAGRRLYEEGHVPGAAFLDVDADLAGEPGERGRHPLPGAAAFGRAARRAGIGSGGRVVACDEAGEGAAARLWWLLRHFGHPAPAVLDGGMRAWREAGAPVESGSPAAGRPDGDFEPQPREDDTISAGELLGRLGDPRLALLDARAPERYAGEREPIDPVAGHIPGALSVPFAEVAPEGRFLAPAQLRERLQGTGAGAEDLVAYCGSGVTACVLLLAAEAAGLPGGRLYPGSWSEWCGRGLPAETGR